MKGSREYQIFHKFINKEKISLSDYLFIILQMPFDLIEFILSGIVIFTPLQSITLRVLSTKPKFSEEHGNAM